MTKLYHTPVSTCCPTSAETWAAQGPSIFTQGPIKGSLSDNAHHANMATAQIERRRAAGELMTPVRGLSHSQEEHIRAFKARGEIEKLNMKRKRI